MSETAWILYQIGGVEPNKFRFVITAGFDDRAVEGQLHEGEFIDTTTTLLGELGGDVTVLTADRAALQAAEQCMADFIEVYKRDGTMLVFDEAVKSMRLDGLAKVRAALGKG